MTDFSSHVWLPGAVALSPRRNLSSLHSRSSASGVAASELAAHARALYSPPHAAPSTSGLLLTIKVVCIGALAARVWMFSGTFWSASGVFGNQVTLYRIPTDAPNAPGSIDASEPGAKGPSAPSPQHAIVPPGRGPWSL